MGNEATPTPTPKPTPFEDPTLKRQRQANEAAAAAKAKAEAAAAAKKAAADKKKEQSNKTQADKDRLAQALVNFYVPGGPTDTQGRPQGIVGILMGMKNSAQFAADPNYTPNFQNPTTQEEYKTEYEENKKYLLLFAKAFEKKYKVSVLDVASSNGLVQLGTSSNADTANKVFSPDFLYQVLSDNPNKSQKFLEPKTFKPKTTVPTAPQAFVVPPQVARGTDGLTPVDPNQPVKLNFETATDSQGNIVNYWTGNGQAAIPVAFLGDPKTGEYLRHNKGYVRGTSGISNAASPQTVDEAFQHIVNELHNTPDGVKNFKNLLIAKHVILPSAVNATMLDPTAIDGTTSNAIMAMIQMTTAHNISLAALGKPDQKFMSVNDFLNNMNALPTTTTNTNVTYAKINPKDYGMSIDTMFQSVLGRGATEEELKHFSNQLQQYADKNPTKTTDTVTDTRNGQSTSSQSSGGLSAESAQSMMRDQALHTEGAEDYTKGAKFFDWFSQAIGGPSQVGR